MKPIFRRGDEEGLFREVTLELRYNCRKGLILAEIREENCRQRIKKWYFRVSGAEGTWGLVQQHKGQCG